ncbi:MAG: hypothetical protein ACOH5I_25035 [Oligoflexus sp.]
MIFHKILLLTSFLLFLLGCQAKLFQSGVGSSKKPGAVSEESDSLQGKLSEESEGIGGYPLHCYALAGKASEPSADSYGRRLIVESTGQKLNLGELAHSWNWGIEGDSLATVSIRDLGDSNSQWHVIFAFSQSERNGVLSLDARINFSVRWKNRTDEQQIQNSLAEVLVREELGDGQQMQRTEDGILFTISYDEQKATARVFAKTNGIQDVANDMEEIDLGNGSYAYIFSSDNVSYQPGDVIEFRFYAADFQGIQTFLPGPEEDRWFPPMVL